MKDSPGVETDAPVSRQYELNIYEHYGWLPCWGPSYAGMVNPMLAGVQTTPDIEVLQATRDPGDPHLRSVEEVTGYYVEATDGEVGHIEEFLIEDETWLLRYAVIDTKNWLPARRVVVSPAWLTDTDWNEQKLKVGLSRQQVEESPEYEPAAVGREYEDHLVRHYGNASSRIYCISGKGIGCTVSINGWPRLLCGVMARSPADRSAPLQHGITAVAGTPSGVHISPA